MTQSYADAADEARDRGVLDPDDLTAREVQQEMERFINPENPESKGARELIRGTTDAAMQQMVRFDNGARAGKRENLTAWTDRWGNLMAQNMRTGTRRKLVDSEER